MSVQRGGTKLRWVKTSKNHWGEGKVHLEFYDKLNKYWRLYCTDSHYNTTDVDDFTMISCTVCSKHYVAKECEKPVP